MKLEIIRSSTNLSEYLNKYKFQEELTAELDKIDNNTAIDELILLKIVLWKINRYPDLTKIPFDKLNKLSELKPEDFKKVRSFLDEILGIKGIGLPMASTILRFRNPQTFPIIDRRAYRVIMGKNYSESKDYKILINTYFNYIDKCRKISSENDIPFEQIDRVLYLFDKDRNKKISLYKK